MQFMPLVMTGMMAWFPCGLVLYWLTNTLLTIAQHAHQSSGRSRGRQAAILNRSLLSIPREPRTVNSPDTIAAIASAPGGRSRCHSSFRSRRTADRDRHLGHAARRAPRALSNFLDAQGRSVMRASPCTFPRRPRTPRRLLELQGHGGHSSSLVLKRLLNSAAAWRAPASSASALFLNGKIDIAQAEAIAI